MLIMGLLTILVIAIGLSFDTFAVSLSYGVLQARISFIQAIRIALILALFQGGLTVMGYFLGFLVSDELSAVDHWVAITLLSFLGIRMILEGMKRKDGSTVRDYSKPFTLYTIALSTSIDAFAVGISFALLAVRIWISGLIIGIITFFAAMTAIRIGKSAGERLGNKVEIIGGMILVAIGVKIFLEHMLAT